MGVLRNPHVLQLVHGNALTLEGKKMAQKFRKERTYSVQQSENISLGQAGSILVTGTTAVTCGAPSGVFVAIQFIEDTVFGSSSGGLVAETEQLFLDDTGAGTDIDADGGAAVDGETFPQGMTIFGRWTGFTLVSGACIAYVGG